MANHKIVYLIATTGAGDNQQTKWREIGSAYECRDGSLNLKLDIHPGLTFNIRNPKSNSELRSAVSDGVSQKERQGPRDDENEIPS